MSTPELGSVATESLRTPPSEGTAVFFARFVAFATANKMILADPASSLCEATSMILDQEEMTHLRRRLQEHLDILAKELGVRIAVGLATFTANNAIFKVEVAALQEDGTAVTRQAEHFQRLARTYGLEPTDLGRTFRDGAKVYKIVGARPRNREYPILAEEVGTRIVFKFPANRVKTLLATTPPDQTP